MATEDLGELRNLSVGAECLWQLRVPGTAIPLPPSSSRHNHPARGRGGRANRRGRRWPPKTSGSSGIFPSGLSVCGNYGFPEPPSPYPLPPPGTIIRQEEGEGVLTAEAADGHRRPRGAQESFRRG